MRKAFVGLSSPIGYNYSNNFETEKGKPNPLLDSPMGLFLFYDEIWFINRRTCPLNCENLPYVKFIDEEYDLNKIDLEQFSWENFQIEKYISNETLRDSGISWKNAIELNVGTNRFGIDNHGRGFQIGSINASPNPTARNLIIDDFIANHFGLELITNSLTSILASSTTIDTKGELKNSLTQLLICENIPNFQLAEGPYHELIEDLRSESLLKSFRNKIDTVSENKSKTDLDLLKAEIEKSMDRYLYELIIKQVDRKQIFKSVSSAVIGQVPVLGNIYGGLEGGWNVYNSIKDRKEAGWIGFLAKARLKFD
jgi:hypothetical protein